MADPGHDIADIHSPEPNHEINVDDVDELIGNSIPTEVFMHDQPEGNGTTNNHKTAESEQSISQLLPLSVLDSDAGIADSIEVPPALQEEEGGSHVRSELRKDAAHDRASGLAEESRVMEDVSSHPSGQPEAHDNVTSNHGSVQPAGILFSNNSRRQEVKDNPRNEVPATDAGAGGEEDSSSLFIPDETSPTALPFPQPSDLSTMPPALTPQPVQSTPGPTNSTFSRIRSIQHKLKVRQGSEARVRHHYESLPDAETYLAATRSPGFSLGQGYTKENSEKDDKKAREEYMRQKNKYDQLRAANGGRLSFNDDVEWMRIVNAETKRRDKRKRDEAKDREDDGIELFPKSNNRQESDERETEDAVDADQWNQASSSLSGSTLPRGLKRSPISIQEAELASMKVALDAKQDQPIKKRKGLEEEPSSAASSSKSRTRSKGSKTKSKASSARSSKRPRQTIKEKRATEAAIRQTTSLFTSDVFKNQPAEDAPDQPTFTSKNKANALKELVASVPSDSLKAARGDMANLMMALKDFDGHSSVKASVNGMWLVRGMRTSLKHYQVLGAAFMRRRENSTEEPRGGLLADQMGLGKTLMTLANIVNGHSKGGNCRPTLLVATPALITQWMREIGLHTDIGLTVMKYSSGNRIDSNNPEQVLLSFDVILTTYTEVMRSYPKHDPPVDCQTTEQKLAWWRETFETERGILHRIMFHRVVLDEAQAIKNHTSRTSIACRALMARHKWALSGTPVLNRLEELYPYFKFLDVPHTGSFKIFKNNYCGGGDRDSQERLLVRLATFMMRRSHEDVMFDAPILKLPTASQLLHWCEFNSVERAIYEIVRQRFAKRINMWAKKGTLEKSYSNALVMLLRLRQLTAHVLMLQYVMHDLLEREDIEQIRDVVQNAAADQNTLKGRVIMAIRKQLEDYAAKKQRKSNEEPLDEEDGELDEPDDEDTAGSTADGAKDPETGANFGKHYNFKPFLNSLTTGEKWEAKKERSSCGCCGQSPPVSPWKTSCGHLLCGRCYDTAFLQSAEQGQTNTTCHACGQQFHGARLLDEDEAASLSGPVTRSKKKREDKVRERMEQQDISEEWLRMGDQGVLPSAKTIAVKAQILNWIQKDADVKIIIYTQFLAMIRILEKMCNEEGWQTEQYHGKMSFQARDKAIVQFADNARVRVLLASLRCGGLGLNLTMASRVIVIDPWWNKAVEQQAFCRVYRFGQQQKTYLTKFCVQNTVDDRLVEMQEKKQKEIDEVMDDKNETAKKLSIRDLMRLFGNLQEDSSGRPFILVDNPDPRGGFAADQDDEGYADDL